MDGDLGALMQSVLSDPAQMAKITELAQGLMGSDKPSEPAPAQSPAFSDGESKLLSALGASLGGGSSRSTALLKAMRPYMRAEKQEKLDRALKLTQMVRVVQSVMRQIGDGHGV